MALHEFGHFLGLGHSEDPGAVMYPSLMMGTTKRSPNGDDLAGVAAEYGSGTPVTSNTAAYRTFIPFVTRVGQ